MIGVFVLINYTVQALWSEFCWVSLTGQCNIWVLSLLPLVSSSFSYAFSVIAAGYKGA